MALLGFAIVAAGSSADPRASRRERLVDLIEREDERARALRRQVDLLQGRISALEEGEARGSLERLRARMDDLAPAAGTAAVQGPGLRVELRDSALREAPTGDPNDLVIHEQDLQAVVNALWAGGAEAVAINGERITASSAVRCVGNTLLLHGNVYAPPYRIAAIGPPRGMRAALRSDALVQRFTVLSEELKLGFDVQDATRLRLPAFRGLLAGA